MVNFAERIAYWYLRFNGFLFVENYVHHKTDGHNHTSDADLLGIRIKNSVEKVEGSRLEPHETLPTELGEFASHVAVIVRVKSGQSNDPGSAFAPDRLQYALQFMGIVPDDKTNEVSKTLEAGKSYKGEPDWLIAKLFVAEAPNCDEAINIKLNCALNFIEKRLHAYSDRKSANRMFFPDELTQFLAWQSTQTNNKGLYS